MLTTCREYDIYIRNSSNVNKTNYCIFIASIVDKIMIILNFITELYTLNHPYCLAV